MTDLEEYLRFRGLDCHVVTNCEDYKNCDVCLAEHIKKHDAKVRQDAIDEFSNSLINPKNYERYDFDDCLTDSDKANDFFKYVFDIAEQLKE